MKDMKRIEDWLKEHSISNFIITSDLQVVVHGNVNLNGKLKENKLPVEFKSVDGYFDISNNSLTSLEGAPQVVLKDFNCSKNSLSSLLGAPKKVGDFDCSNNSLKNLSYCPKEVLGIFNCSNNNIDSIKGTPRTIRGDFDCSHNSIVSLVGGVKHVEGIFNCSFNNLEELLGGPISVVDDYVCNSNELLTLNNIADQIGGDVYCDIRLNHLKSFFNEKSNYWKYNGAELISHIYKPIVALESKEEISSWLNKYDIKNFEILSDNSVNVKGNVKLTKRLSNFSKLPLSFNEVNGSFDISDNELTSLEGSPKKVHGDYLAFKNEISSLKGSPKEVDGNFIVLKNNINSLENGPSLVKEDFICSHNPLKTLEGLNNVHGSIFTGVYIPNIKCQKYMYKTVTTYKYPGDLITTYLDEIYVSLTEEEKQFEKNRQKLAIAITELIDKNELKKEMITEMFLKNLTKYNLIELKEKVMRIKNPPTQEVKKELSAKELLSLSFEQEL